VPLAVTEGLRLRGVDVLTCSDDGTSELDDPSLRGPATELGRVLFSQDADLLAVAKAWLEGPTPLNPPETLREILRGWHTMKT
jgi:hypothetical protein